MIASWGDAATEDIYHGRTTARVRRFSPDVARIAKRKLDYLHAAQSLNDLRAPPGNRLEALEGKHKGRHSIRVNAQFRLVFRWENGAHEVTLTDYH